MVKDKIKTGKKTKGVSKKSNNNIDLKNKDYNLVKVKSNYSDVIGITILITIILIIMMGYIIYYLNNLKKCDCFKKENVENTVSIDYLIIIEAIGLTMNVIILINLITLYMSVNKIKSGGASYHQKLFIYLILSLYVLIYGLFVYNVYKLSQNVKEDCLCATHPVRFLLYIQAFLVFVYLVLLVLGLFLI